MEKNKPSEHLLKDLSLSLSEKRYLLTFLSKSDSYALIFSSMMIVGIFLPWLSHPGLLTLTGLMSSGHIHLLLAIYTIQRVFQVAHYHLKSLERKHLRPLSMRLQRISLSYIFIGFISTLVAMINLIYFSSQRDSFTLLDIRAGFYLSLFSGLGIFCCGLERFRS